MQEKRYSRIQPMIFICFLLPYTILANLLLFGTGCFSSFSAFFLRLGISLVYFAVIYSMVGLAAMLIKTRFPGDHELFRRIGILLPLFCVMNLLSIQGVYWLYESLHGQAIRVQRSMEWWVTGYSCLATSILTFLNEAALGWEKWRTAMMETDRLQTAYQRSRLMSLKRQLHPHFLFNCFNTLSSLIREDEKEAERFLDELTRVYRYLLKGADEQLVDLGEELKFIDSYLYLVKTRFGPALAVDIRVDKDAETKKIAPMSLLIVLENIIYRNAFSKSQPLEIGIETRIDDALLIRNTVQPKPYTGDDPEEGLDDLVAKYRLIGAGDLSIHETGVSRSINIPLIQKSGLGS